MIGVKADAIPAVDGVQMLLIDVDRRDDGGAPEVTSITPEVPTFSRPTSRISQEMRRRLYEKLRTEGVVKINEAVIDGLNRRRADLASLARSVEQRLDGDQRKQLESWLKTGEGVPAGLLVRATAWLRRELASMPDPMREQRGAPLAKAISAEIASRQIPGSRWARNVGCGAHLENPSDEEKARMFSCGMGSMPVIATRFLTFYSVGG